MMEIDEDELIVKKLKSRKHALEEEDKKITRGTNQTRNEILQHPSRTGGVILPFINVYTIENFQMHMYVPTYFTNKRL